MATGVLTTQEALTYLKVTKSTLLKLVREGKIPAAKVGRGWRFLKSELDAFLRGGAKVTTWVVSDNTDVHVKLQCTLCERIFFFPAGDATFVPEGTAVGDHVEVGCPLCGEEAWARVVELGGRGLMQLVL